MKTHTYEAPGGLHRVSIAGGWDVGGWDVLISSNQLGFPSGCLLAKCE